MRIKINPKYSKLKPFLENLHQNFDKEGKSIYKGRNEIRVFEVEGLMLNVKSFKIPHLINKIAYAYLRGSKAKHSFEYALKIRECGAETPEPIACVEILKKGLFNHSYYISIHHEYDFTFWDLNRNNIPNKETIISQFTKFTYQKLHQNNILHLDYSPGNILIKKKGELQYDFSIVDINRVQFKNISFYNGLNNFAKLWAEENELTIIAKEYASLNKRNEQEATKYLIKEEALHRNSVNRKGKIKTYIKKLFKG